MGSRHSVSLVILFLVRNICYLVSVVYIGRSIQKMQCCLHGFYDEDCQK